MLSRKSSANTSLFQQREKRTTILKPFLNKTLNINLKEGKEKVPLSFGLLFVELLKLPTTRIAHYYSPRTTTDNTLYFFFYI